MLGRWKLGLQMAWNVFFICTTVFIMGTDKISQLPETLTGFYFNIVVLQIPHSVFLSPPVALLWGQSQQDHGSISGYSVGLFHFSSLLGVGVSHLHQGLQLHV